MPRTTEYPEKFKIAVVEAVERGQGQSEVARLFGITRQLVRLWIVNFNDRGSLKVMKRQGRPRKTTKREDVMLCRMSKRNPRLTATQITNEYNKISTAKIHCSTVKRRLNQEGLYGRRPSRKPHISAKNRKARLRFAKQHKNWNAKNWAKVLWSDESKFNLFSSDGVQYVRRPKNKRNDIRYQVPTVKHGGGNVMIWGCCSTNGVGPLVRITDKMHGLLYVNIIANHMLPYAKSKMRRG